MKPYTYSKEKSIPFFEKYKSQILSFLLAIFILPPWFCYPPSNALDGSWVRAINLAVKNNLQFGSDFIFTYGPLGYLSTRNIQYIHSVYLFLFDMFVFFCFFYVVNKFLSINKKWFFIFFIAILFFKGNEISELLFLLFSILSIFNLRNNFNNYIEVICCATIGIVIFFIKINYGIITYPILILLSVYALFNNKKAFIIFILTIIILLVTIFHKVNMDFIHYIKFGLQLIMYYPEAMSMEINPGSRAFISAIILFIILLMAVFVYLLRLKEQKENKFVNIYAVLLLIIVAFLQYKNGFTRADAHTDIFFAEFPLFFVFTMMLLKFDESKYVKIVCIFIFILVDYNIGIPNMTSGKAIVYNSTIQPAINYFSTIFKGQPENTDPKLILPQNKLEEIGRSTIDILPVDVVLLQLNNLNYWPRPIIQTYSAYSRVLDSLNANHFYIKNRPEYAMVRIEGIDNRLVAWEESMTKAMLHLNYKYADFVSLNNDTALTNTQQCYLLLKSKGETHKYPKFEKMYERVINMDDTLHVNFPEGSVVYMTADINYNIPGKIKSIIYQPPLLYISLFLNDSCNRFIYKKIFRAELQEPELISNIMCVNTDFRDFIKGEINKTSKVKAFAFHANSWGLKKKIKITFYEFSNY